MSKKNSQIGHLLWVIITVSIILGLYHMWSEPSYLSLNTYLALFCLAYIAAMIYYISYVVRYSGWIRWSSLALMLLCLCVVAYDVFIMSLSALQF